MDIITKTWFNNGENDGDVIIKCKNDMTIRAHSLVLKHFSNLFQSVYDLHIEQKNTDTLELDLHMYNHTYIQIVINVMYNSEYKIPHKWVYLIIFFEISDYLLPTDVFLPIMNNKFEIINKVLKNPNPVTHDNIHDFLIKVLGLIGNIDNYYYNKIRDKIYEVNNYIMSEVYVMIELYQRDKNSYNEKFGDLYINDRWDCDGITPEIKNKIYQTATNFILNK